MQRPSFDKKIELLAPAGDLSRAKTAILYGADAIYLGGMHYSLRSRASNFTMEDIKEVCAFAKAHGARVHVTTNIIPHDEDFDGVADYFKALQDYGVTAIITASPSYMKIAKECAPKLEIHCSTQLSITNSQTAQYLADMLQVDRVVLARECTLQEVQEITKHCPVETEAFIHGGMCVNYSGRCTLSNRMTLRDANRGGCAQSCRWQYHLLDKDKELSDEQSMFSMGSKDLMSASIVKDLILAGVSSLKIEGRMKTEYYVASVVSGYRHLIDALYEKNFELSEEELLFHTREIVKGENRDICTGFYEGDAGEESIIFHAYDNNHVSHDFLGRVQKYEDGIAYLLTRNPIDAGDVIEVLSPGIANRKFTVEWMQDNKGEMLTASRRPMTIISMPVPFVVKEGDIFRRAG